MNVFRLMDIAQALAKRPPRASAARLCAACGGLLPRMNKRLRGCSVECRAKLNRERQSIKDAMRRDQIDRSKADRISPIMVFQRDNWTCQICGVHTPPSHRGMRLMDAPEMDHVIPLAKGGMHTWGNVRCACRGCNGAKGARMSTDPS